MHLRLHLRELQSQNFSRRSRRPKLPRKVRRSQYWWALSRHIATVYYISRPPLSQNPPSSPGHYRPGVGEGGVVLKLGKKSTEKIDIDSNFPWSVLLTSLLLSTLKMTSNVQNSSRTTSRIRVTGFMAKFWTFWCPVLWLIIVKIMENCCRFCLWQ